MMNVHLTYFNDSFMMYGNPLQYSCLENPMDGEDWWATVHWSQSDTTERLHFHFTVFSQDTLLQKQNLKSYGHRNTPQILTAPSGGA